MTVDSTRDYMKEKSIYKKWFSNCKCVSNGQDVNIKQPCSSSLHKQNAESAEHLTNR